MKKIAGILMVLAFLGQALQAQDTVVVQTLTYDSTSRAGYWEFPSDTNHWRKVIMQYSMRCHDALIGNANGIGCYEWDYSCNTIITDSSRVDSAKASRSSHAISNFSGSQFDLTNAVTYSYFDYLQHHVTYGGTVSESAYSIVDTGATFNSDLPFDNTNTKARTQFLYTAADLTGQGLTAGPITSLRLNLTTLGAPSGFVRIKLKGISDPTLVENAPHVNGFTEVYFANTSFPALGWQQFNFYTPFNWNGTDNLLVDVSVHNGTALASDYTAWHLTPGNMSLAALSEDAHLVFSGAEYIDIDPSALGTISNEITVAFWSYGDAILPQNTGIFEGTNAAGARHANVHLPWSDGNVYWDCGADNGGYDRINIAVSPNDYKGRWTHWAFTKNAVTGDMKIWKDGQLFHSGTGKTKPIDLEHFRIGAGLTGGFAYYGRINDFQIWDKALDGPTIQAWLYQDISVIHPNYSNLVAYYPFYEGTGNVVHDDSPNNLQSLISGAPNWRYMRGDENFRNFVGSTSRPEIQFVRGVYTTTNDNTVMVRDSVANPQHRVIRYTVIGTDLVAVDTNYYFQAGWQYVYDAQTGAVLDSVLVGTDSTIFLTTLNYYTKGVARYEIMSFVTPYGNGLDLGPNGVMWEFDMTDFVPILNGWKRMSMEYGGQNQEEIDIRFLFIRGTPPRDVLDIQPIWPLASHGMTTIFNDGAYEPRNIYLRPNSAGWKIRSTITGHQQNGEFIARWHWLNVAGGPQEAHWRVWKECADMPVYPQGGTWLYDRAGWCPGVPSDLFELEVNPTLGVPGDSLLVDYGMDVISNTSATNYLNCTQFVTYGTPNFSLDASVIDVKRPSANVRYRRFNPACNQPIVIIRNEGTTPLTSLTITYNMKGGPTRTHNWTGNLDFLESEEVTLLVDNATFWTGTDPVFEVHLSAPNGGTDLQPDNDVYAVPYNAWDNYTGATMDFYWRTNNQPSQNSWRLTDESGATVLQSSPFLTATTTYTEVFTLPAGCYTLKFDDTGDDGLYYWASPGNGQGFARTRENGNTRKTFNPEFGKFFKYDFWTDGTMDGTEISTPTHLTLYPNPTSGEFFVEMDGYVNRDVDMRVYDMMGRELWSKTVNPGGSGWAKESIDLSNRAKGTYILKLWDGEKMESRQIVKS